MNEVGGSESGLGLRAIKSSRSSDANFEYDDSEWDVGIGNLIIDLDADIEKNNEANRNNNNSSTNSDTTSGTGGPSGPPPSSNTSSSNPGSSNPQMHIPLTSSSGNNSNTSSSSSGSSGNNKSVKSAGGSSNTSSSLPKGAPTNSSSTSDLTGVMEHSSVVDKGLKMKIKRTKTGTKSGADAKHEIVKNDVVGSSNGTSGGGSTGTNNSGYSNSNKTISDPVSSKNSHSSHKDKLLIKDGVLHENSHDSGSINNVTSGNSKQEATPGMGDHGGKVKTPRKATPKEKKVKNVSNVGNSSNIKKDEKNTDSKSLSNSSSGNNSSSGSSGTHAKDNKEFFSTTVNLNVPNVIPNSSSSAFVKATATIKVPTAPSSSAASALSSSGSGLHNVHSSGDSSSSPSSNNRPQNLSTSSNSASNSNNTPWGTVSPTKAADRGRLSPSAVNLSNSTEKAIGNTFNKKARAFTVSEKTGSAPDDNSSGSSASTSYRNQGALSINSAPTDLSSSSSSYVQGSPASQPGGSGSSVGSTKETGKGARNTSSASTSSPTSATQDACVGTSVGTITEPDCLGPCEPGTSVTLEGIVWHETESGVLVVNVTWRGKTYVGTLIDCTKNDWAPPRFCDSPTSDLEMRTPKNRGKRGRAQTATPVNEPVVADTRSQNAKLRNGAKGRRGSNNNNAAAFVAPASPVKPDTWPKRKTRGSENETQDDGNPRNPKRPKVSKDDRRDRRSNSPAENEKSGPSSPQLIECPEPNCSKKYKHINGLRYHQSHAHTNNFVVAEDSDSNLSTASNTNTSTPADQTNSSSTETTVEPMVVDNTPDVSDASANANNSAPNSVPEETLSAPSTPGKKTSVTPPATTKINDKIYDLSTDSDLNSSKDLNSQTQESAESFNKSAKGTLNKLPTQNKDTSSVNDQDSKPENLSKDSSVSLASSTPTTSTPTITPRTPILTVPVVPYMSLQSRNLMHGHVMNVPRVETSLNSRESENNTVKTSASQSVPASKNAPWQPHAHSQSHSGHGLHVMNNSPTQSITVPLNIPMNIPEKLGGGKDKDKNNAEPPSKKSKHKKKSKDKDREREGKSKGGDRDKHENSSKNSGGSLTGGPSDFSRTGLFHNAHLGPDAMGGNNRSKEMGGDEDSARKNSIENRDDPQSPAYSDISDANDSGPDSELNVGSAMKDNCKGLVIPGEIKKDALSVPGVPGGQPLSFFNHGFYSPYLDTPTSSSNPAVRQAKESPVIEDADKSRPGPKHPTLPATSQPPVTPQIGGDEARRSPKMDYHSKYPYPNYFSYPYPGHPGYHNHYDHPSFGNPNLVSENSFNPGTSGRMFPNVEDRDKEGSSGTEQRMGSLAKTGKLVDKEESLGGIQIKQEPIERDERSGKERPQATATPMNSVENKEVEIKSEFGSDHVEPNRIPPYMTNNSKHHSKEREHKRDERHERRHESKNQDSKSDNVKQGRNSSQSSDKTSSKSEEVEPKERKDEGSKPTMETTGPPPPPTASAYYLPQSYLPTNPFGLPFDPSHPLYRQVLVPGPYSHPASPYMHPGSMSRFPSPGGPTPLPEDLSRPSPTGPGNPSKALDLLQHHAAQYYSAHKIHELQERALKSPSPQVAASQRERDNSSSGPGSSLPSTPSSPGSHPLGGPGHPGGGRNSVGSTSGSNSAMPKPADLSKDAKPTIGPGGTILPGGPNSDNVRTPPPTQHHVHSHTHHHTHVGIGYPIIPTVPPQYSPHYGVLATPPAAPSVIPPFPSQKPN